MKIDLFSQIESELPIKQENSNAFNTVAMLASAQGIDLRYLTRPETLYYDESGNIKHLIIKNGQLNDTRDDIFVLGGIQTENDINPNELRAAFGRDSESEIKGKQMFRGDFAQLLNKQNFTQLFQLIEKQNWHIHFSVVQTIYYAFVDIIDSIDGLRNDPFNNKAILYEVLTKDLTRTVAHFKKYKYPDIAADKKQAFLDGIISIVEDYVKSMSDKREMSRYIKLINGLKEAKSQTKLVFIQDEQPDEWVSEFTQFYHQELCTFPYKKLIFDEEKEVQRDLCDYTEQQMNETKMANFQFDNSNDNPMIQVSDLVVSVLRRYIKFLDRERADIDYDIINFSDAQMANFKLMNRVLEQSLEYNPLFVHFIASIRVVEKYHLYRQLFGQ